MTLEEYIAALKSPEGPPQPDIPWWALFQSGSPTDLLSQDIDLQELFGGPLQLSREGPVYGLYGLNQIKPNVGMSPIDHFRRYQQHIERGDWNSYGPGGNPRELQITPRKEQDVILRGLRR